MTRSSGNEIVADGGTKYGDMIENHEWKEPEPEVDPDAPVRVKGHEVNVIHTTDPTEDMGYGRDKYTAHVVHKDDGPRVLYFVKHRWKGNYWRDVKELDWRDVPGIVRQKVASVVACDGVDSLDPGVRLIEEGGVSTWDRKKRLEEQRSKGDSDE